MNYTPLIKDRWDDSYFNNRFLTDQRRVSQFELDKTFIHKYVASGNLLDVGCSTGEFCRYLNWDGDLYGMEINDFARSEASQFISFSRDLFNSSSFFDCIVFRGTIQHVDVPFFMIKSAYTALKPGGHLFFISTPNTDSILYRLKLQLPMLDPPRNFFLPGLSSFSNSLTNIGFQILESQSPYLKTPYCNLFKDHFLFLLNLLSPFYFPHAFWGSSFNLVVRKPT